MRNIENSVSKVTLDISKDIEATFSYRKWKTQFIMVGGNPMNESRKIDSKSIEAIDLFSVIPMLSKAGLSVMSMLVKSVEWEVDIATGEKYTVGFVVVNDSLLDAFNLSRRVFIKGMKDLRSKGLATNVSRGVYMMNPLAIIPSRLPQALIEWLQAINDKDNLDVIRDCEGCSILDVKNDLDLSLDHFIDVLSK